MGVEQGRFNPPASLTEVYGGCNLWEGAAPRNAGLEHKPIGNNEYPIRVIGKNDQ